MSVEAVARFPVLRDADKQQAEYFWHMFDGRKSEICEQLEARLDALARCQRDGDLGGVRRQKHLVRALEFDLRRIDRMLLALRVRLGMPTLRRTL
jgi:hypothetical protein